MGLSWAAYHAGEEKAYDCGRCHTTGYKPEGNQDGKPGLIGTWALDGIQCERCHGPASLHVAAPYDQPLEVNRDQELCGDCHVRGDVTQIDVSGSFIRHHEQYEELFFSKHRTLECVDCHDPHGPARYRDEAAVVRQGIRVECQSCHWEEATFFPEQHVLPACVDCHMARLTKSALGDADRFQGDLRTHLFAINPFAEEQFYQVGDKIYSYNYITLDCACKHCHSEGGMATVKSDEDLHNFAIGYHERP